LLLDFRTDGLHLRGAETRTDDEIVCEGSGSAKFENGNARGFFFFGGLDGEADTLW